MISGLTEARAIKRTRLLGERREIILQHLRDGVPITNIAILEGIDLDVMRDECRKLRKQYDIDYQPKAEQYVPGLTRETASLRTALGSLLCRMADADNMHEIEIAQATGVPARCQNRARNGSTHNWTLSQMERLATANNTTFHRMVAKATLSLDDVIDILPSIIPRKSTLTLAQQQAQEKKIKCLIDSLNSSR